MIPPSSVATTARQAGAGVPDRVGSGIFVLQKLVVRPIDGTTNMFVARSQFPNFFDLKLREAISHGLPSFDCYNLGRVVRQLGVD